MIISKPLILFIDAYDSFSSNIISLLETTLACTVRTIRIDNRSLSTDTLLHAELRHYAAVVCGPGPGHPTDEKDVGIMRRIWRLCDEETIPVLGVCLGFQSLCLEFGGRIRRLRNPMHGIVRNVRHIGETGHGKDTIFDGLAGIRTTLYHSLCVDIGQDDKPTRTWEDSRYDISPIAPNLLPLAWVEAEEGWPDDERILVAVKHRSKPFWGLQYHPESICTDVGSQKVVRNWFRHAQWWNWTQRGYSIIRRGEVKGDVATRQSLLSQTAGKQEDGLMSHGLHRRYKCQTIELPADFSLADFLEKQTKFNTQNIVLESTNSHVKIGAPDVKGRYSIVGVNIDDCTRMEYTVGDNFVLAFDGTTRVEHINLATYGGIWQFLSHYVEKRAIANGNSEIPFWGGFMGYTTYELGLETINVESGGRSSSRPDLCFAWVTQSIVVDHLKNLMHIQTLEDETCIQSKSQTRVLLQEVSRILNLLQLKQNLDHIPLRYTGVTINPPNPDEYEKKVQDCQAYIRSGDSYELCLTDQTVVKVPKMETVNAVGTVSGDLPLSWSLYRSLRQRQAAPFASYLRLGSATFISASPERFITWDDTTGKCSLRPMKGTVKKSPSVATLEQANTHLHIPKEEAENLMIVDLVRHDLHSVLGSGNVHVPRLMVVEEYASVFQMISVVEGHYPPTVPFKGNTNLEAYSEEARQTRYTGMDVLAASLPPGSMTGAPKKRSCEILQVLEGGRDRSLYSGVVGYMDVGGRGDFSVNIRCMFRWDDEDDKNEVWHIGAGGAVTALSTPVGEREEMITKLSSTLGVFDH
ncbi:hypothetical protein BP5796_08833 [Coleophoma crateriformis]|uniref:aminodeoxychorismate synthase n=1 Tax=Coleophoma crateriformis TaxID=565419 RepID=A0A3D8R8X1_9HELO|nr:hypothetical protein BP5796_08833 [Coleophoma crateriformis]